MKTVDFVDSQEQKAHNNVGISFWEVRLQLVDKLSIFDNQLQRWNHKGPLFSVVAIRIKARIESVSVFHSLHVHHRRDFHPPLC